VKLQDCWSFGFAKVSALTVFHLLPLKPLLLSGIILFFLLLACLWLISYLIRHLLHRSTQKTQNQHTAG
jgi:hypothetical protein